MKHNRSQLNGRWEEVGSSRFQLLEKLLQESSNVVKSTRWVFCRCLSFCPLCLCSCLSWSVFSCPGSSTPDLGDWVSWVPLLNFDTKSDFWDLRPVRHLITVTRVKGSSTSVKHQLVKHAIQPEYCPLMFFMFGWWSLLKCDYYWSVYAAQPTKPITKAISDRSQIDFIQFSFQSRNFVALEPLNFFA